MYHVVFFTASHEQIFDMINLLLEGNFSNVMFSSNRQQKELQSLDDIPVHPGYWYPHTWYINSLIFDPSSQQEVVEIPIYNSPEFTTSFNDINISLNKLSNQSRWSIFPWGGAKRFSGFGFLSSQRIIFDQFMFILSKIQKVNLISNYSVTDSISLHIHSILFKGYYHPAYRIWDICNCHIDLPLLITDLRFDEETFMTFGWEPAHYELKETFILGENRVLKVYQVLDKKSFESMCKLSTQEPETLLWVHSSTNLQELKNLLVESESDDSESDLKYLQKILSVTEWFYGIDRDRGDSGDSLFVARDSLLLSRFNEVHLDDGYQLISCF